MSQFLEGLESVEALSAFVEAHSGWAVYPTSVNRAGGAILFMAKKGREKRLGALAPQPSVLDFHLTFTTVEERGTKAYLGWAMLDHANAEALRRAFPWVAPIRVGVRRSAGLGDRLGMATPGHIRAMRHVRGVAPVFAQQSIREMERTHRTPEEVMDAASWGVFQEGWRAGYGADADHLKTTADIDACLKAGFVMYTLDPRDHVDNAAHTDAFSVLRGKYEALPWEGLETTPNALWSRYANRRWDLGEIALDMTEEALLRAACKYGRALAQLSALYRYLRAHLEGREWELEVSVDEADTPTSPVEHFFIASELRRLGVEWVSLAPRYVGRFEKGVDYIGDLAAFERDFAQHAAIAKALGPYKLSLHSGSDKFSIYPVAVRWAGDLVHLKTAGTSYLEALRAVARVEPALFREILGFALAHYETDRASYHVSGQLERMLRPEALSDDRLEEALDHFDTRQALHVTFGTVLTAQGADGKYLFRDRLYAVLEEHEEAHYAALESHIARHLAPFSI